MKVRKLSKAVGAIIEGVKVHDLSIKTFDAIYRLWLEHSLIIIRNQDIAPDDQVSFAKRFGDPDSYPFLKGIPGHPEINEVLKDKDDKLNFGGVWHTDTPYKKKPPKASMLYAREIPPSGGDTLFSNQYLAQDHLSDDIKEQIKNRYAIFRSDPVEVSQTRSSKKSTQLGEDKSFVARHPIVRTHPETNKKSLYLSPAHTTQIEGFDTQASGELLSLLFAHQTKPDFIGRHKWKKGDIVIWDNRCLLHFPINDYHGHRRLLHRITLKGDIPR